MPQRPDRDDDTPPGGHDGGAAASAPLADVVPIGGARPEIVTRAVFQTWFEDHHVAVFNYLARMLDSDVAEDLTAATFMEAWRARRTFDPARGTPIRWLLGIATNVLRKHARAATRARGHMADSIFGADELLTLADRDPLASDRFDDREALAIVAEELARVDATTQEIVALVALEELSYSEIAEVVGVPIGTVRSRLFRFRERLSLRMLGEGADHDGRARKRGSA